MYAVIDDRGNQIKVSQGEVLAIDLTEAEPGTELIFDKVLLYSDDSGVKIGQPAIAGAKVVAEVIGPEAGKKVYGMTFRRRKNSKVRKGHRQHYTQIRIKEITA
jgi:large subunit ribosomal protein L21